MVHDPLDDVLDLEHGFYQDGYQQGTKDGIAAGRNEGRLIGLEKGFGKFSESARLAGKAIVWANRLPLYRRAASSVATSADSTASTASTERSTAAHPRLADLPDNARLAKHVSTLYALVEPESLSIENTDEAVNDFDDRMRRAQGKTKIIEKMISENVAREREREAAARSRH